MEADPVTLFTILDLSPDSGAEVVKKRCQEKLLKLHPDKNGGSETPEYHRVSCWGMILKKLVGLFLIRPKFSLALEVAPRMS